MTEQLLSSLDDLEDSTDRAGGGLKRLDRQSFTASIRSCRDAFRVDGPQVVGPENRSFSHFCLRHIGDHSLRNSARQCKDRLHGAFTINRAERFDGKLALVTNVDDFAAEEIVYRYKSLADIERGFRVLKSDLEIAPVFHRLPDRIRAHALICFIALVLYRIMRMRLKENGSGVSPKTALELLGRIQRHRVTVGPQEHTGISKATPQQLDIFAALEISAPK